MKKSLFGSESEIMAVVDGFRKRTLPKERWTHEAHLVTGVWYHVNHSDLEAICYLRTGIAAYNESTGGKNTPEDGYHETMTLFWCKTISEFVAANRGLSLVALCQKFLASEQATKEYPLRFYARDVLFSLKARATWVAPNAMA